MTTITVYNGDNLQTAINDATAGDTLQIRAGTYIGHNTWGGNANSLDTCFYVNKALTLQRYPGDAKPIITYDPASPPYESLYQAYGTVIYITNGTGDAIMDGLEVVGMNALGAVPSLGGLAPADNYCFQFYTNASDCAVRNCLIRDGNQGMYFVSPNGIVENNEIYNIGAANPDTRLHGIYSGNNDNVTIRYNYIHDCTGYGIHEYSANTNHKIYGNICAHNHGGALIYGTGNLIYNNTFSWNDGGAWLSNDTYRVGLMIDSTATGNTIRNNIMWKNGLYPPSTRTYGDFYTLYTAGNTYDHNLYGTIQNGSSSYGTSLDATDIRDDPLFVSATPTDWPHFRLQATSPALNRGYVLASPYNVGLDGVNPGTTWPPPTRAWD